MTTREKWKRAGRVALAVAGVLTALLADALQLTAFDTLSWREGYRLPATMALLSAMAAGIGAVLIWFGAGKRARMTVFAAGFAGIAALQLWFFLDTHWFALPVRLGIAVMGLVFAALAGVCGRMAYKEHKERKE